MPVCHQVRHLTLVPEAKTPQQLKKRYVRMYVRMYAHTYGVVEVVYTCMCVTVLNPLCCTNTQVQFITYVHVHTYVCTVGTVRVLII